MAYNPEKAGSKSYETKPRETPAPSEKVVKALGSTAIKGSKK